MVLLSTSLFALLGFALATPVERAQPLTKVPIRKPLRKIAAKDLVNKEHDRIQEFNARASGVHGELTSGPAVNEDVSYYASLVVGGQTFKNLIVDTGSSNTWVGAGTRFTGSATNTGDRCSVSYGSGSFSGTYYIGPVSYAGVTASKQGFCVASSSTGFTGADGIFGVGPVILTQGTVSGVSQVPTYLDNIKSQIGTEALGVYFAPESGSDTSDANGELTLGGADTGKYKGTLYYFPKSTSGSFAYYWGLSSISLSYSGSSLGSGLSAIVDTGTTLIYIPTSSYNSFLSASGGRTDSSTGLARYSTKPTGTFTITVSGTSFPLTPSQYLVPTAQYSYYGLSSGYYYAWINDGGSSGVNFIIGQKFLEQYYSVFDTSNSRIGLATRA